MNIKSDISKSFKWSAITEIIVKCFTPILNAILARILLPEAFAPLTTITMIISFGEVFIESGFKKFLIQYAFSDDIESQNAFDVALWTNLMLSIGIWGLIAIFSKPLAEFLRSPEIWNGIAVSGIILPLHSLTGILVAKLQKDLKFQKLFVVRVITTLIPLVITVPLALFGLDYWALIIGNIASAVAQAITLLIISKYKVHFYFSFTLLKIMWSYGIWTMMDGIIIWLTTWIDSFIISMYMSDYYLGIYKNSISTINALFSIVTASVIPVLFVGLSKLQNDDKHFSLFFNSIQLRLAMLLIPLGVGVFVYSDLVVSFLFGNKWMEASKIIGITGLTTSLRTVFVSICSDAYRAKGKFKIPLFLQLLDLCILIPTCIISARRGFWALVYARAFIKLDLLIPEMVIIKKILGIDIKNQIKRIIPIILSTLIMAIVCYLSKDIFDNIIWEFISIINAIICYVIMLLIFPSTRNEILSLSIFNKIKEYRK